MILEPVHLNSYPISFIYWWLWDFWQILQPRAWFFISKMGKIKHLLKSVAGGGGFICQYLLEQCLAYMKPLINICYYHHHHFISLGNSPVLVVSIWKNYRSLYCSLSKCVFCCLPAASCVPPCQNGGMCLRPQLCVCKPGTKGQACETTAAQDTSSPGFGGQGPAAASSWVPPEQAAKRSSSKKSDLLPRVSPLAQMTLTLKPKPSVGLSQQIHSQWVFWTWLQLGSIFMFSWMHCFKSLFLSCTICRNHSDNNILPEDFAFYVYISSLFKIVDMCV